MLPPVVSREKELFPALPATKSVGLSKKKLGQVLPHPTFKEVGTHNLQNIKDLKQSNSVVNENKFASLSVMMEILNRIAQWEHLQIFLKIWNLKNQCQIGRI